MLSIAIGGGVTYYIQSVRQASGIHTYRESRDFKGVLEIFKQDWYWLSTRDYNEPRLQWMLKDGSPNEYEAQFFGKMRVKVLREDNKVVGFITYYMKNFYEGIVLFLAVRSDARGKRYGQTLINYAINELSKQGALVVSLVTRVTNKSAIKLYTRIGFKQTKIEDGFITFVLTL